MNQIKNIFIVANTAWGPLLSGGDSIFIECAKRWARMGYEVNIFVWEDGLEMCRRNNLTSVKYSLWSAAQFKKFGFFMLYAARIIIGCLKGWKFNFKGPCVVYSASDFWPDALPALIMKLKNKEARWVAGFYLFAPAPWQKDSPYKGAEFIKGLFYWLMQLPIYWIIKKYADDVFVTSEPDVRRFITKKKDRPKVTIIHGGVDMAPSTRYLESGKVIPSETRRYDACFVGRFHPQKGVLEIIDIWKLVCKDKPNARLAMIGRGSLENEMEHRIKKSKLEKNIDLLGFKDGEEKYEIFKQSRIVVHPATYDSGGMAAAGAMAWGLPGVSFDLASLKTYYPRGMIKVPKGDKQGFANEILNLLSDEKLYSNTASQARRLILEEWDWDKKAEFISNKVFVAN